MVNKDLVRLKHMLDSAEAILIFLKGKKRTSLNTNRMLSSAVIREFEILGEAAGKVSKRTQKQFPKLPWKQLVGMRNRLIHAYFDVSYDIVWKTVKDHLPGFIRQLEDAVSKLEKKSR
ncbi:MAG TPA: DUF86 domain-containing protein [Rhabdochlamydiaceae bacterium]|jgi:uncharacterized protein with HEPN domain